VHRRQLLPVHLVGEQGIGAEGLLERDRAAELGQLALLLGLVEGGESDVPGGRVDPDGKSVAIGTLKGSVLFVDVRTGKVTVGAAGHQGDVQSVAMSPDGRLFVSVGDDAKAIVWDARTFAPVETLTGHGGRITGAVFSADSRTLFTSSLDGTVLEWDVGNTRRFGRPFSYHPGPLAYDPAAPSAPALAVAPDGKRFAVDGPKWQVEVLRLSDQRPVLRFGSHVTAVAWSPDGRLIATGGDDGRVELWSARTGTLVRALTGFHRSGAKQSAEAVQAIVFDRTGASIGAVDGTYFAGPSQPFGDVAVWATATGRPVFAPRRFAAPPESIAFSPDGTRLVTGLSNGRADVLGLPSGKLVRTIEPTREDVTSVAFARDGTLATGTWAGLVQRWNVVSGAQIGHPVLASPAPIASLAFDSAGDTFSTTGGSDGTAKLWTTATEQQLGATFQTDPGQWGAARFTSDGKALVVVYGDGTGFVWPTTTSAWIEHACAVAGRNLTREESQRYVPHRPYGHVCT